MVNTVFGRTWTKMEKKSQIQQAKKYTGLCKTPSLLLILVKQPATQSLVKPALEKQPCVIPWSTGQKEYNTMIQKDSS